MGEWRVSFYHLVPLLTVLYILRFMICTFRWGISGNVKRKTASGCHGHHVPVLDGTALYYEQVRWPLYDARFNLRLSFLHGPVIYINHGTNSLSAALLRFLHTSFLYATGQPCRAGDTTILINSLVGDNGTLRKLLNSCASRAPSIAAGKYLSRGHRIVLMPYGPDWLHHRKAFAVLLTREKVRTLWAAALRVEAMVLVDRLADLVHFSHSTLGTRLVDEISRFTASTVLQIAYARRADTPDDPILKDLQVVSRNIASAFQPGQYWVESFALLDLFPEFVSPWKQKLNADHKFELSLFDRLLEDVETRLGSSREVRERQAPEVVIPVEECAATQLMRRQVYHGGLDRTAIAYLAAGLFEAGTETTAMTINTFLLGAACNPEATRRAQAELDGLMASNADECGQNTVPDFDDLQDMPLLSAFVKEALRLTPTGASGVGHTCAGAGSQSFELGRGKRGSGPDKLYVPIGATVLANIYGLHHDSEAFNEPWLFNPNRWLPAAESRETIQSSTLDHTHACFAFGFGKRICPGSSLASYSLTMAIALLLLCFDFSWTEEAARIYAEMKDQQNDEYSAWKRMFGEGGQRAIERERALKGVSHRGREGEIGSMLIDAHVAFKLSRGQVGNCVRLVRRENWVGLAVVQEALIVLRG